MTPPILFLIFNRPDTTAKTFDFVRKNRPEKLFIAADGPRKDHLGEREQCQKTREVVATIDWPCEVKYLFRESNLGCKKAVSTAITWFFEHVESGVVLEDDCLPGQSFLPFCAELLERYRDNPRVMHISGNCFVSVSDHQKESYYPSHLNHVWGWATWRRAWALYDVEMRAFDNFRPAHIKGILDSSPEVIDYWMNNLGKTRAGLLDTWDYQWTFCLWINGGLSLTPRVNLVTNVGFDERATHTKSADHPGAMVIADELGSDFHHPEILCRDADLDLNTLRKHFQIHPITKPTFLKRIWRASKWALVKLYGK